MVNLRQVENGPAATGKQVQGLYPFDLLDHTPDEAMHWWALYTMARQEKSLARDLYGYGVSYFLPLVKTTKVYGRRKVARQVPLFPGYVFLHGTEDDRVRALTTNRISRILPVSDPLRMHADLSQLHQLIETGAPLTPENRLSVGDRVRLKYGPMAGIEGTVLRRRGETRLLVSVHFLQQGASVAVDDYMLEPVSHSK